MGPFKSSQSSTSQVNMLFALCKNSIKNDKYPLVCLQSGYAYGVHSMKKEMYYECSLVEKYGYVLDTDNTEIESVFEYFSFPEFSIKRQQLEFRT